MVKETPEKKKPEESVGVVQKLPSVPAEEDQDELMHELIMEEVEMKDKKVDEGM